MSLQPELPLPVPAETARVARAALPADNVYLRLRDTFGTVYDDAAFASLFPSRGQPAATPWRLALILVFQYAEGLSDRQAADAVRSRLDWKYALGLELTDPGLDASVLSEFRTRLLAADVEQQVLDPLLAHCQAAGLLHARGTQRTDATHVLAAVRVLNRLALVGETLRQALNSLAVVAPAWLQGVLDPAWGERYGARFEDYRLPKGEAARTALAEQIGADGFRLFAALDAADAPAWLWTVPAVATLRQVWLQQYVLREETLQWRRASDLPPAAHLIVSPYDPEARTAVKRELVWSGYKGHFTETCAPETPALITHTETTPATTPDVVMPARIHAALDRKGLLPAKHVVDGGYMDAGGLLDSAVTYGITLVGPVAQDHQWQARAGQGFALSDFTLDWAAQTAICPLGQPSQRWTPTQDRAGNPVIKVHFAAATCAACPSRAACTTASTSGRRLTLRAQAEHAALQAARQQQTTATFKADYRIRAGVEGTLSQAVRASGLRRARYVGVAKTRLQHVLTATALNVRRLGAWWAEHPRTTTRTAAFVPLLAVHT